MWVPVQLWKHTRKNKHQALNVRKAVVSGELEEMAEEGNFTSHFISFINAGIMGYVYSVIFRFFNFINI